MVWEGKTIETSQAMGLDILKSPFSLMYFCEYKGKWVWVYVM